MMSKIKLMNALHFKQYWLWVMVLLVSQHIRAGQGSSKAVEPVQQQSAQSLYAYCNIAPFEYASKDVKSVIAQKFLGTKGWWRKEIVCPVTSSVERVEFNKQGTHCLINEPKNPLL